MMQRMCNGCKKLIRIGDNYIHVEHDNEMAVVKYAPQDTNEKDFHNWACVGIQVVAEAEANARWEAQLQEDRDAHTRARS